MNSPPNDPSATRSIFLRIRRWLACAIFALCSAVIAFWILRLAPAMAPVKEGTAEEYWQIVCPTQPWNVIPTPRAHGLYDGFYIYDKRNMHGSELFRVPEEEVAARFDREVQKIEKAYQDGKLFSFYKDGYERWRQSKAKEKKNVTALVKETEQVEIEFWKVKNPTMLAYFGEVEKFPEKLLERQDRYRLTQFLEWAYLSFLVLLLMWPFIWPTKKLQWAMMWGAIPILFFLPVYMGYASFTFTSAGPSGGILYPWLIAHFGGHGWELSSLDRYLLQRMPLLLEPLSTPIGQPLSLSGTGFPGPTKVLSAGAFVAASVFLILVFGPRFYKDNRRC